MLALLPSGVELHWDWSNPLIILVMAGVVLLVVSIVFRRTPISSQARPPREGAPGKDLILPGFSTIAPRQNPTRPARAPENGPGQQPLVPSPGTNRPNSRAVVERRAVPRRKGKSVKVHVSDAGVISEPRPGWVIDRSRRGLCLVVSEPVAEGTVLSVRAVDAPDTTPWAQVEVTNNRPKGNRWALGCRFTSDLPWSVLLLFG